MYLVDLNLTPPQVNGNISLPQTHLVEVLEKENFVTILYPTYNFHSNKNLTFLANLQGTGFVSMLSEEL